MRPADMYSDDELFEDDLYYFTVDTPLRNGEEYLAEAAALSEAAEGEEASAEEIDTKTAFHRACEQSDLEVMAILLRTGASVDESNPDEWTPLMKACSRGDTEVVDFLLRKGADPNAQRDQCTPLMACCVNSHVDEDSRVSCMQKLLAKGANVNIQDKSGMTALMNACSSGLSSLVAQLLLMYNIRINMQDADGWTALFHAVNGNNRSIVKQLVEAGIDVNIADNKGKTALQVANAKGLEEIVDILAPANRENEAELMVRQLSEPLMEFLLQMPDANGNGGFYSDVRDLFVGLGMERIYDRCKITVGMHEFLTMGDDLKKLGIKLGPVRSRIKTQGIHRYHIYPWKRTSLHSFDRNANFSLEDSINCLANVTKHLAVMCATLKYLKLRVPLRNKGHAIATKDLISNLINSYVELIMLNNNLDTIVKITKKIRPIGEEEVDLVRFREPPKSQHHYYYYYYALIAGSAVALLYYKLR